MIAMTLGANGITTGVAVTYVPQPVIALGYVEDERGRLLVCLPLRGNHFQRGVKTLKNFSLIIQDGALYVGRPSGDDNAAVFLAIEAEAITPQVEDEEENLAWFITGGFTLVPVTDQMPKLAKASKCLILNPGGRVWIYQAHAPITAGQHMLYLTYKNKALTARVPDHVAGVTVLKDFTDNE